MTVVEMAVVEMQKKYEAWQQLKWQKKYGCSRNGRRSMTVVEIAEEAWQQQKWQRKQGSSRNGRRSMAVVNVAEEAWQY